MRLRFLLLALSLIAASSQQDCHDYVLISIRGTYENQGPSIGFKGMINTTLNTLPNGIEYDAVYPAAPEQTAYLGADDVVRYIDTGLQSCPNQKYAILGYSQGASAAGIALRNYTDPSGAGYKAIKAVLVIGNPYHKPNASVNVDENGTNDTSSYAGAFPWNATQGIPEVYYTNGELLDICYTADVVCAPQYPGANFTQHLQYTFNENVQMMGANFLIPRLSSNSTGTNGTASGVPSSSTTAPGGSATSSSGSATSTSSASRTSATGGATSTMPSSPGTAANIMPSSFLALIVGVIAMLATSGL